VLISKSKVTAGYGEAGKLADKHGLGITKKLAFVSSKAVPY
jgi:hypothetical protein